MRKTNKISDFRCYWDPVNELWVAALKLKLKNIDQSETKKRTEFRVVVYVANDRRFLFLSLRFLFDNTKKEHEASDTSRWCIVKVW
jgi:hypothetical protein